VNRFAARLLAAFVLAAAILALPHAACAQSDPATALAKQADDLITQSKYEDAAKTLEQLVKNYPTSPRAISAKVNLGYLLYLTRKYDGAIAQLKPLAADKALPAGLREFASIYLAQSRAAGAAAKLAAAKNTAYAEAIADYTAFLKDFPESSTREEALYGRALCYYYTEKYDDAATDLEECIRKYPQSSSRSDSQYLLGAAYAARASALIASQKDAEAAPFITKASAAFTAVTRGAERPALFNDANFQLGEVLANAGKYNEAMSAYRAVLSLGETEDALKRRIAALQASLRGANERTRPDILRQRAREEDALAQLKEKPDTQFDAVGKIAFCFLQTKQYDEARTVANHLLKLATPALRRYPAYIRTLSFLMQGKADEGKKEADAFTGTYPKDPLAESFDLLLGNLYIETGKAELAIPLLERQMRDYPNSRLKDSVFLLLLSARGKTGQGGSAEEELRKLITKTTDPQQKTIAQRNLARILAQNKKFDDAAAVYAELAKSAPDEGVRDEAGFQHAMMLESGGKRAESAAAFEAFAQSHLAKPSLAAPALFRAAQSLEALGKIPDAVNLYKRVVAVFPKEAVAPFAQQQIARSFTLVRPIKLDDALAAFDDLVKMFPASELAPAARFYQASLLAQANRRDEARERYLKLQEEFPKSPVAADAQRQVIRMSVDQINALGAWAAFDEAEKQQWQKLADEILTGVGAVIDKHPDSPALADALSEAVKVWNARVRNGVTRAGEAENWFAGYAGRNSANPTVVAKIQFARAAVPFAAGDVKRSAEIMRQAYEGNAAARFSSDDYDRLGTALLETGDAAGAAKVFDRLKNEFPKDPYAQANALYGSAAALAAQGKNAEADRGFEELRRTAPWSEKAPRATLQQAKAKLASGDVDGALTLLKSVIEARTQKPIPDTKSEAMWLAGEIEEKRGNLATAGGYYAMVDTFFGDTAPNNRGPEGLLKAAAIFESTGKNRDDAINAYEALVETYPTHPQVTRARERAQALRQQAPR
jgi:TolA-binding protein